MSLVRGLNRRTFVGTAGGVVAAVPLSLFGSSVNARPESDVAQQINGAATIRPFRVNVPDAEFAELRRRINATRWLDPETVADDSQGVPQATSRRLMRYWARSTIGASVRQR
jgi:hypothetical protein